MSAPSDPLIRAARWVKGGGLLAYPTETVWGLAADSRSAEAMLRLQRWKGRGADAPVSVLVDNVEAAEAQGAAFSGPARLLADAFWPGPLTLIVPTEHRFAPGVARADGAVGLRCSSHPLAGALARRLDREGGGPPTATSLNRSGEPPAAHRDAARVCCGVGPGTTVSGCSSDAPRLLDVDGAECGGEEPTTVIDATEKPPRVLRWGAIDSNALGPLLGEWSGS